MSQPASIKSPVLLIAEDEPEILSNLVEYFESLDIVVHGVTSGELALEVAGRVTPDVIVTDLVMPGFSGISLLEKLCARPETASIPVIVLSARVELEIRERVSSLGAIDFITKPFSLARLREAVMAALPASVSNPE
jgi:CheY-like chemotaxis protein